MDMQRVDMFIMTNQKNLPAEKIPFLRDRLMQCDPQRWVMVSSVEMKDPTTLLLLSLFLGGWGVDRFMLGETGMGLLKLLTGGCCGVLTIIDWFSVQNKTRELNFQRIMALL